MIPMIFQAVAGTTTKTTFCRRRRLRRFEPLDVRRLLAGDPNDPVWTPSDVVPAFTADQPRPAAFSTFSLDPNRLARQLDSAPLEFSLGPEEPAWLRPDRLRGDVSLPTPDGSLARFRLAEISIMDDSLAGKLHGVATYSGYAIDGSPSRVRVTVTPRGLHATVRAAGGDFVVDPIPGDADGLHISYFENDIAPAPGDRFDFDDAEHLHSIADDVASPVSASAEIPPAMQTSGPELREYRLAVAATGEFTVRHGGTVQSAQAKIVEAINDVNGLYESELAIRFVLVDNSDIVYVDGATDPYTNNNRATMQTENQANIDAVIGDANYDIGHVFATSGGGRSSIGVVGRSGVKARAVSANNLNSSWLTVAHEIGHQFSSRHTWNGTNGSCTTGQWNPDFSMEPGSGSTIMSYGGFCGIDNVVTTRDTYFHSVSYDAILFYVNNFIPNVATITATGNTAPIVDAGPDYTIPAETPFRLDPPTAVDNENDPITTNWEQRDLGNAAKALASPDDGAGPLFRSYPRTSDPTRTLPRLSELLNNTAPIGEQLPSTNRDINFRLNANDGRGGASSDAMVVHVVATGSPFAVTAPNSSVVWPSNSIQSVTWDVAGTDGGAINVSSVNILLSTDGGNSFDTVLAGDVPNDGSHEILVPESLTAEARIKVEPVGNIFFDVSNTNFTIIAGVSVESVQINDGTVQRSNVTSVSVTFDGDAGASADAFEIRNRADGSIVPASTTLATINNKTVATMTFVPGANVDARLSGNSLADGNYQLTVLASAVERLGNDYTFGESEADAFFRLFGDGDGDRDVDGQDYIGFGRTFLKHAFDPDFSEAYDFDGDGDVDGQDYGNFGMRLLKQLPFA